MFKLISNDINFSKFKFKTKALKYQLHTLMFVDPPPPPSYVDLCHALLHAGEILSMVLTIFDHRK
jgi:hypothetical protein